MTAPLQVDVPGEGYQKGLIACQAACPVHTDARGYVRSIAEGRFHETCLIARGLNPFASICGRICGAPCEAACRLPREVIAREVDMIRALGVEIHCGVTEDRDVPFAGIRRGHAAVILAVGAKSSRPLGLPGERGPGVFGGVDFLRAVALGEPVPLGREVVVIGGGNVAGDLAHGTGLLIDAVASGNAAARSVYRHLTGREVRAGQVNVPLMGHFRRRERGYEAPRRVPPPAPCAARRMRSRWNGSRSGPNGGANDDSGGPDTVAARSRADAPAGLAGTQRIVVGGCVHAVRRHRDDAAAKGGRPAFAVWLGSKQEPGARKMRTGWIPLVRRAGS